jgi:Leucine-rich repeat (LRR) protein
LAEATAANRAFHCTDIPINSTVVACLDSRAPTAAPTPAPTTCIDAIFALSPDATGTVTVASGLAACPLPNPLVRTTFRFPPSTTTLAFPFSSAADPAVVPGQFAPFCADLAPLTLDLRDHNYTVLARDAFAPFAANLAALLLCHGAITQIDPGAFRTLSLLETLWLNDNRLSSLDWIRDMPAPLPVLSTLWLDDNRITSVLNGSLNQLGGLETVRLSGNRIVQIHSDPFADLPNLTVTGVTL